MFCSLPMRASSKNLSPYPRVVFFWTPVNESNMNRYQQVIISPTVLISSNNRAPFALCSPLEGMSPSLSSKKPQSRSHPGHFSFVFLLHQLSHFFLHMYFCNIFNTHLWLLFLYSCLEYCSKFLLVLLSKILFPNKFMFSTGKTLFPKHLLI